MRLQSFRTRCRMAAAVAAALCCLSVAVADVPSCQGVQSAAPSVGSLTSGIVRPSMSEAQRVADFRYPLMGPSTTGTSFWDFVPAEFFVALNRDKASIEQMSTAQWSEAVSSAVALRRRVAFNLVGYDYARIFDEIDWLFVMARDGKFVTDDESTRLGLVGELEIDPSFTAARMLSEPPGDDTLWLMVAGLYVDSRIELSALSEPQATRMLDAYWHGFADNNSASIDSQRQHLLRYLCNHPHVRYLDLRAERLAGSDDESLQRQASEQIDRLDTYVQETLSDFDTFAEAVAPGSERFRFLDLVPAGDQRTRVSDMLAIDGLAKAFVQVRQTVYDALDSHGEIGVRHRVWTRTPAHTQFAWPDTCLSVARYPTTTSSIFGPPWVMTTSCTPLAIDRNRVYAEHQEAN